MFLSVCSTYMTPAGGSVKRGPPVSVLRLYLSTVLQQQFSHRQVAISRGNMELRETVISLDKMNQSRFFFNIFLSIMRPCLTNVAPLSSRAFKSSPLWTRAWTSASIAASLTPRNSSMRSCVIPAHTGVATTVKLITVPGYFLWGV